MSLPETFEQFKESSISERPPSHWPLELQSLWWDAKGNWEASHELAQELSNEIGNWIHAYLHRKEGDRFNAGYWYRQVKKPYPTMTIAEEHQMLVLYILKQKQ